MPETVIQDSGALARNKPPPPPPPPSEGTTQLAEIQRDCVIASHMAAPPPAFEGEQSLEEAGIYVSLTYRVLDAPATMARVKSPKAGAVVLFAGTHPPLHIIHTHTH